ncbi:MAG: protease modulator HflC [Candidatus Omnitrophica bacterium]|nr:protease modulator HflC [Candidatus Omnitrophota bacterium]
MMKIGSLLLGFAVIIAILFVSGVAYTVDETQQVVVTQFGEPIGQPIVEAGLYFKLPFIQNANYFDKRMLQWDGDPNEIPTLDKRYIWVDTIARWRIVDALKFMQSVGTEMGAYARLDDVVDAATRDAISNLKLIETVRDSNRLHEQSVSAKTTDNIGAGDTNIERISVGRRALTRNILEHASLITPQYGIELIDLRIKRINYVEEVRRKVFDRMISERKRAAEQYRSEGQGSKAEIEGQTVKGLQEIQSEAYRKAQEIKGEADAEAIKIYANAYNKDPEFYSFIRTLETYRDTIGSDTTLILDTDSDYYKYLRSIQGNK